MENIIQLLAYILPIIAILCLILVVSINLYLRIRRQILVKVNCWFCNQWTKVHYDERNCFECPSCLQYNGFNSDGDYNRPIPAQHDEMLNQHLPFPEKVNGYTAPASNGLCHLCNNNQQLKIYQLANYIPLNEANYDVEIEHFQKQLEKAYKLCPPCDNVVKKTIQTQSCLLGLKFSELRRKGVRLLDLNSSYGGISKRSKRLFLMKLLNVFLVGFACLNLMFVLSRIDFSDKNLKKHTPKWLFTYVITTKNLCLLALSLYRNILENLSSSTDFNVYKNIVTNSESLINYLLEVPLIDKTYMYIATTWESLGVFMQPNLPKLENAVLLCSVGVLLQFISLLWNERNNYKNKFVCLFLWSVLTYLHWKYPSKQYVNIYVNTLQIAASAVIIASTISAKKAKISKQKKMKRISKHSVKQQQESNHNLGQFSDCEDEHPDCNSVNSDLVLKSSISHNKSSPIPLRNRQHFAQKSFQDIRSTATAKDSLNTSFTSAKSCISDFASISDMNNVFNTSFINHSPTDNKKDFDNIDVSLNRLHLGTPMVKRSPPNTFYVTKDVQRPKPVISPAKLKNVTQNSWVAGGFWRDSNGVLLPINNPTNLSRSSSQTSGFVSLEPNNFNSSPSSVNNSLCGELECNSVLSEPVYYTIPRRNFACHGNNMMRTFYPYLNHEQMVYVTPCGFNNVFANRNVQFSQNLYKMNGEQANFTMPNINAYRTHKPDSLLNDWYGKNF